MPLRSFKPTSGRCKLCHGLVELSVGANEKPPGECPKCGQTIEPAPSLTSPQPRVTRKPSISEAKTAGFKVLKRVGKGEYESQ